jgi:hypothetical protein
MEPLDLVNRITDFGRRMTDSVNGTTIVWQVEQLIQTSVLHAADESIRQVEHLIQIPVLQLPDRIRHVE